MSRVLAAGLVMGLLAGETLAQAPFGFTDALGQAQKAAGNGLLLKGRPERNVQGAVFGFYFDIEGKLHEIEVKGPPGQIVKNEPITPSAKDNVSQEVLDALRAYRGAKLPYARYLQIAADAVGGGEPTSIEVKLQNGKLVMVVVVNGKTVVMDLASGRVLSKS